MKHLYKYPQAKFPYDKLIEENGKRSKKDLEYELVDTGVFKNNAYFDVYTEYAKADTDDILVRISIHNRGQEWAPITVLPTLWFRNLWSFGLGEKPDIKLIADKQHYAVLEAQSEDFESPYYLYYEHPEQTLFTENETNKEAIYGHANESPFVKDAINDAVVQNDFKIFRKKTNGTKCSPLYQYEIPSGGKVEIRLRLSAEEFTANPLKEGFENIFSARIKEANSFYKQFQPKNHPAEPELVNIQRQAFAGMLWTKQYYNIDVTTWLKGEHEVDLPARQKGSTRNKKWKTLSNEDIISMPDKWEYPWYAAWDLAFHCVPLAMLDANFAKHQLILFLRERYMAPNGQIPAYEWSFSDVNPPVHAWACMKVYKMEKEKEGKGDVDFLKRVFQKLLINFTWWVNSKDRNNNNVFEGGFLGLDNIGPFDRSSNIPGGGFLEQADGTSWMALYCLNMLDMALEIAQVDPTFEDVATKFLEHFVYIAESLNKIGEDWTGSWDEEEGFFYDILALPSDEFIPIKIRSLVGLTSFFATLLIEEERLDKVPNFKKKMIWFKNFRMKHGLYAVMEEFKEDDNVLLSLLPRERLIKMLHALLDEKEFFSPHGIRSLSKKHEKPYVFSIEGKEFSITYEPGESTTHMYGGNSNWRGPVWMPVNYILIDALRIMDSYYGKSLQVNCPTDSNNKMNLGEVATTISRALISLFEKDKKGHRPVNGALKLYQNDPDFQDLILFYEYFHGDNGRGLGASHQTGWTGVIAQLIDHCGWSKNAKP